MLLPMKILLLAAFAVTLGSLPASAQLSQPDSLALRAWEDSINRYCDDLFENPVQRKRQEASNHIISALKTALLTPRSFEFPFDRLESIAIVQPADSAFRIFTWQLAYDNNTYRYFGAIQMNRDSLPLYPLIDYSVLMSDDVSRLVTDNERWYGALYYDIVRVSTDTMHYYTVFGYDGNNAMSTKKVADVLWFTPEGDVRFGAPIFDLGEEHPRFRYVMEFKKGAAAGIRYSREYEKIVFDHLIPINKESEGMYFNYVPDGSYDAFEWNGGSWTIIDKLFHFKLEDGEFPTGN